MIKLLWLIILYPFAEIITFSWSIAHFGFSWVLLWVIGSALLGIFLLRFHQFGAAVTLTTLFKSPVSLYELLWPLRYLLAGILFIIPGIISDIIGTILLLPLKGKTLQQPPFNQDFTHQTTTPSSENKLVIEGEYSEIKPNDSQKKH